MTLKYYHISLEFVGLFLSLGHKQNKLGKGLGLGEPFQTAIYEHRLGPKLATEPLNSIMRLLDKVVFPTS